MKDRRVSVVMPCLDEAATIEECVSRAFASLAAAGLEGEVIVVDNGSTDGSGALAAAAGATVIDEPERGYGSAYRAGFVAAQGDYIVMIDADLTYDFAEIPAFVRALDDGADVVIGNRMQNIQPGAMSPLSRVGNPLLSGFLNLLYDTSVGDAHCGMRGLRRDVLPVLQLRTTGMELASEMVIRAAKSGLDVRELPIALHPREGRSKLSPFRDGWRHLRLMLVYSPTALFIVPGLVTTAVGIVVMILVFAHMDLFGREFYVHTLIGGSLLTVTGSQIVGLGLCGKTYGVYHLGEHDPWLTGMQARWKLEHGLLVGALVAAAGVLLGCIIIGIWIGHSFGTLGEERLAILGATLVTVGIQVIFTSFLLSIIGLGAPRRA